MPDRVTGDDLKLRVNTGSTTGPVTVTVTDAIGDTVGTADGTLVGSGYWDAVVENPSSRIEGLWTATWNTPQGEIEQEFTVGAPGYLDKHTIRARVFSRIHNTHYGQVKFHSGDKVVDSFLYGGQGDYVGWWFIPDGTSIAAGIPRRVKAYNGDGLTLDQTYPFTLPAGTRYHLVYGVSPFELDDAMAEVMASLRRREYPTLHADGLSLAEHSIVKRVGYVDVPAGWDFVSAVYVTDPETHEEAREASEWDVIPGRRVEIKRVHSDASVRILGARYPRPAVFEDSVLDINPAMVIPGTAHRLHTSRSRGASTDPDEHIRRAVMAYQEFEDTLRRFRARIPNNLREVLP
jgi:hypothetical protein